MTLKSDAIRAFLNAKAHPDLAALYHKGMECQVNVAQGRGTRIEVGGLGSKPGIAFTHEGETWKSFRIPAKAMSDPVDNDSSQSFNFDQHVEGVGLTGWDWQKRKSMWLAYDFDAMMGHSEKHAKKLSECELEEVQKAVTGLPFVTVRRSTSGKGLHLYIFLEGVPTDNHTEHAALARSILSYIAGITGYNFTDKVDICGGNMWVWHRKMIGTDGLKLIRQGGVFPTAKVPGNWRDHLTVVGRKSTRTVPKIDGVQQNQFEELSGQRSKVKVDSEHLKLINWLNEAGSPGWWDSDNHMLVTHTHYLELAHKALKMKGEFHTTSTGREAGADINCFAFPTRDGSWAIRRYGGFGTGEHASWTQGSQSWTRCSYNRDLTLDDVARMFRAVEVDTGGYQFSTVKLGCEALLKLGVVVKLPQSLWSRYMRVKDARQEYKLLVMVPEMQGDPTGEEMDGWMVERKFHRRLYPNPKSGVPDESISLGDWDDCIRHIISENGEDLGWVVCTEDGTWRHEPVNHVKLFIGSKGVGRKDIDIILGQAIGQAWIIVNQPFQPEYPGDRQWNRSSARFKIAPTLDGEALTYPTWMKLLSHSGGSLDGVIKDHPWCKSNGITSGADYLKLWFACLIRHPQQPLPYLAFYGPQDSGKSSLHEAFCQLILDGGYMDGALALVSGGNFNGELQDSILCTLEEVDLRKGPIYQKVKDWVTAAQISIHIKGQTPYKAPNFTHWIHCVNDRDFIPAFPGDTRITMCLVPALNNEQKIPKRDLWTQLAKEAPDFLAALLSLDIPDSRDRLMIPIIRTSDKEAAEYSAMNHVEQFFQQFVHKVPGALSSIGELHEAFKTWVADPVEVENWGKIKFIRALPQDIIKGRVSGLTGEGKQWEYLGNVHLNPNHKPEKGTPWIPKGLYMVRQN